MKQSIAKRPKCLQATKKDKKQSRKGIFDNAHKLLKRREMIIDAFENGFFSIAEKTTVFSRRR